MSYNWNKLTVVSAIGAACSLTAWIGITNATEETSLLVKQPTTNTTDAGPTLPLPPPSNPNDAPTPSTNSAPSATDLFAPSPATPPQAKQSRPIPPQASAPSSTTAKRPFMRPAEPREPAQGKLVGEEPMPTPLNAPPIVPAPSAATPAAPGVRIKPAPPIDYDTDHDARKMYRTGQVNIVVLVQDPSDGCAYEIPLCIPACCVGEPRVSGDRGLLGRGKVEYKWPCGFKAKIKFRHVIGDIKVEYEGD